jgi:type I restriction enzyme, S subunit
MSYPHYQEYIKSGVEWLGQTPSTWAIKRVGYFFTERREKVSDKDFQPLSVTKNGIVPQLESAAKSDDGDNRKKVCIGDFVINSRSDRKGSSGASSLNGSVSLINTVIFPNKNIDIKFAHHLFRSTSFQEEYYRYGKGIVADLWSTNYSEMKNISIPIPHLNEQKTIVAFLENETVKIDTLIVQQEKLIELLKEKRQIVISNAVTKGLNPDVKTKDSGNSWLNQVPEHWTIGRLKHIKSTEKNSFVDGPFGSNLKSEHFIEGGDVYVIESNFATQGLLEPENLKTISFKHFETINRSEVRSGDIVIAKIGAQYGKSSILPDIDKRAVVSGNSLKLTVNPTIVDVNFVNWFLANLKSLGVIEDIVNATAQPALSLGELNNLPMLMPPLKEQKSIVEYLEEALSKFQSLIDEANINIDLLKERRSALISAAVTGQIDVRNYQIKEAA